MPGDQEETPLTFTKTENGKTTIVSISKENGQIEFKVDVVKDAPQVDDGLNKEEFDFDAVENGTEKTLKTGTHIQGLGTTMSATKVVKQPGKNPEYAVGYSVGASSADKALYAEILKDYAEFSKDGKLDAGEAGKIQDIIDRGLQQLPLKANPKPGHGL